ncbi:MAG TPA: chorismate synthase [Polyangiaceae bacterium]|jgi:chorismate synthase|nr:chorismate synthase [Polyangiaceae bacterium]
MAGNTFGHLFRVTTFGESHGPAVGCVVDGCPPGHVLDLGGVQAALARRRPGQSKLTTPRKEDDVVEVLSGVDGETGRTLGTPLCMVVRNEDARSAAYDDMRHVYRPSHADFAYDAKYGIRAWQGGGRASARETVGRVAAGALAEQVLRARFADLRIVAWVERVHDIDARTHIDPAEVTRDRVEGHPTRCPHEPSARDMEAAILDAKKNGDSLGGWLRVVASGVPAGLGQPVFDKLDALLAQAFMSLPACKAVEIGSGFSSVEATGLLHNDVFEWQPGIEGSPPVMATRTNRSGGVQGGISNGMPIDVRLAFKPTATVLKPQPSADDAGQNVELRAKGRHDPCVLPRAVPIVEAMTALVLIDAWLCQRAQVGDPWPGLGGPLQHR